MVAHADDTTTYAVTPSTQERQRTADALNRAVPRIRLGVVGAI